MSRELHERIKQQHAAREARIRALIEQHGLSLMRFGKGWRIYGARIDLVTADLASVDALDLRPQRSG